MHTYVGNYFAQRDEDGVRPRGDNLSFGG
jgi:hypothetical protein